MFALAASPVEVGALPVNSGMAEFISQTTA
jgi:hypothetical protein